VIDVGRLAELVDTAAKTARAIDQLSLEHRLTLPDAYAVQRASIERRLARGERRVGMKMGFTSRAKMVQMGISDQIWGRLTDAMRVEDGGSIATRFYVHPRVEPEIAFLLGRDLPRAVSAAEALAAVAAVAPALEIIDSRYRAFKFSLADVVADNASSSGFVIGPWSSPSSSPSTDVANLGMILEIDQRPVEIGSSAGILGHPVRSLVAAARLTAEAGEPLRAGDLVMAGGATRAVALRPGLHVRAVVEALGQAEFRVEE
jgi:2-oxo-3-hexenedioate decarboxylase